MLREASLVDFVDAVPSNELDLRVRQISCVISAFQAAKTLSLLEKQTD